MKIRIAEMKDATVLDEMLTKLIRYESRWDGNLDKEYSVKDNYSNMIGHPDCRIYIADCDGWPVGFLCALIYRFPMYRKPVVILDALFVEEPYRHNGYATKLIMELKHFAQEMGASAIELKVFSENAAANSLYSAQGFVETKKYLKLNMELAELEERT